MKLPQFVTEEQLCTVFRVKPLTIKSWLKKGAPKKTKDGYDLEAWREWRNAWMVTKGAAGRQRRFEEELKAERAAASGGDPKVRREEAEARLKELKVMQLERKLVLVDSVTRTMSKYFTICRQLILTFQNSIPILIPEGELRTLVRAEVERLTTNLLTELQECGKDLGKLTEGTGS